MLAAYGYKMMDEAIVNEVLHDNEFSHPKFYHQLFRLLEDMRVFNFIKEERPSTAKQIDLRVKLDYLIRNHKLNSIKQKRYIQIYFSYI